MANDGKNGAQNRPKQPNEDHAKDNWISQSRYQVTAKQKEDQTSRQTDHQKPFFTKQDESRRVRCACALGHDLIWRGRIPAELPSTKGKAGVRASLTIFCEESAITAVPLVSEFRNVAPYRSCLKVRCVYSRGPKVPVTLGCAGGNNSGLGQRNDIGKRNTTR